MDRYHCPHENCNKSYKFRSGLAVHKRTKHGGVRTRAQRQSTRCTVCHKNFSSKSALKQHQQNVHQSNNRRHCWKCTICSKRFSTKKYCEQHVKQHQVHTKTCPHCNKSYKYQHKVCSANGTLKSKLNDDIVSVIKDNIETHQVDTNDYRPIDRNSARKIIISTLQENQAGTPEYSKIIRRLQIKNKSNHSHSTVLQNTVFH